MMSFETFTDLMILLFWSMVAIGGLIGATVWVRERLAGRLAKRAGASQYRDPRPLGKSRSGKQARYSARFVGAGRNWEGEPPGKPS